MFSRDIELGRTDICLITSPKPILFGDDQKYERAEAVQFCRPARRKKSVPIRGPSALFQTSLLLHRCLCPEIPWFLGSLFTRKRHFHSLSVVFWSLNFC